MSEHYFAYGSNLSLEQMIRRTGQNFDSPELRRLAQLPNHRLAFNMHWHDGQVYANLISPGKGVLGVVYSCSPEAFVKLDEFETGYERRRVKVVFPSGEEIDAVCYFAEKPHLGAEASPSADYLLEIISGARQQGLPETYIREIESTAVQ